MRGSDPRDLYWQAQCAVILTKEKLLLREEE